MDWKFVLALIFAVIVAVFAIQNASPVDISFLTWELSISQALVILISACFGALVVLLFSLVRRLKFQVKLKAISKTVSALEQENGQLKLKLEDYVVKSEQHTEQLTEVTKEGTEVQAE